MKKLILAIITILYMGASTGATVHLHYCMGKLADWGLTNHHSRECGKCGMEKALGNGCCKDEQQFHKDNSDQKYNETTAETIQLVPLALPVSSFDLTVNNFLSAQEKRNSFNTSPPGSGLALYIRHRVFRI